MNHFYKRLSLCGICLAVAGVSAVLLPIQGFAASKNITELASECRQQSDDAFLSKEKEAAAKAFDSCTAYQDQSEAQGSTGNRIVALLRLNRLAAIRHLPTPYTSIAIKKAKDVTESDKWIIPEVLSLRAFDTPSNASSTQDLLKAMYSAFDKSGVSEGVEWAMLTTEIGRVRPAWSGSRAIVSKEALLSAFPAAMKTLAAMEPSGTKTMRLISAHLGLATLLEKSDALKAFDELHTAHQLAQEGRQSGLGYIQLVMSNLLESNGPVVLSKREKEVMQIISRSPEPKYKDRLIDALSGVAKSCETVRELHELARDASKQSGQKQGSPGKLLMVSSYYNDGEQIVALVKRLSCLTSEQLQAYDSDKMLAKALLMLFPEEKRSNNQFYRLVEDIEKKIGKPI